MSDTEPPPDPSEDDWRLHAIRRLAEAWLNPWTGKTVPKGTRMTVSSVIRVAKKRLITIPLPNATALLLNSSASAFFLAREIRKRNGIDRSEGDVSFRSDKEAFDYIERMLEAVVLAFTALEAFVNETIPEDYIYARHGRSKVVLEALSKSDIERHVPIDEKLTAVLPAALGCTSPTRSRCWQGYKQLKKTRDRIIHMKTEDRKSAGPELDTVWKTIFLIPAPHLTVKAVTDHFSRAMQIKPGWHSRFPHGQI